METKTKITLAEAASIGHVSYQAIFMAIKKGRLKGWREKKRWMTSQEDFQEYRESKHVTENRKVEGKFIYNVEEGTFSMTQAATLISHHLRQPYPRSKVYYMMRVGVLPAHRKGRCIVVMKHDIINLINHEVRMRDDPKQMRFA